MELATRAIASGPEEQTSPQLHNSAARHRLREFGRKKPWIMLDNKSCQRYHLLMLDIQVIDDPPAATVALDPTRSRLLAKMAETASAPGLATGDGPAGVN